MKRFISSLFFLMLLFFGITFASINFETVTLHYYVGEVKWPLSLVLILAFSVGGIFGCLLTICMTWRLKIENRQLRSKISMAEKEIENLRTIPFSDGK